MYFKFGYKPKYIATKLRLHSSDISSAARKFKMKANDFIYGIGYDPYKDDVPVEEIDLIAK